MCVCARSLCVILKTDVSVIAKKLVIIYMIFQIRLKYDPELLRHSEFQFSNRIHQELLLFYQWFLMIPDSIAINDQVYKFEDILFSNNDIVFKHSFNKVVEMMTKTSAGMLTWRNHGKLFETVTKRALKMSRRTRMQPFNNYRRFETDTFLFYIISISSDLILMAV